MVGTARLPRLACLMAALLMAIVYGPRPVMAEAVSVDHSKEMAASLKVNL